MPISADWIDPAPKYARAGETNTIGCDATGWLPSGVTISSVATSDADGLTIASLAVNTGTFTNDKGGTCAISKGFQFACSGQAAGTTYDVLIAMTLSNSDVKKSKLTLIGVA